jgi:hypothetical protein
VSPPALSWRGIWSTLTVADRVLCVVLLVGSLTLLVGLRASRDTPATAVVTVERAEVARLPLDREARVTIAGALGPVIVEVRDGAVRVAESPCPERICMAAGWKRHAGDVIACVPSGVLVRLVGGKQADDAPDAVTR